MSPRRPMLKEMPSLVAAHHRNFRYAPVFSYLTSLSRNGSGMARDRDEGDSLADLEVFGEHLARQMGYKERTGLEAVRLYLCEKYLWSPETARVLRGDDMRFILADEMKGWTATAVG